jgi:hypothetical protein
MTAFFDEYGERMARRVREAIRAREEGSTLYLVDGHALDGS